MQIHEKMGAWGCMPFAPTLFHFSLLHMAGVAAVQPLPLLCAICRRSNHHPTIRGMRGRAPLAAKQSVIEAGKKAVAAMTCPGAIPLKTAMCACIRVCQYGVTI